MTDERKHDEDDGPVKPQVIDLEAQDVTPEPEADPQPQAAPEPPPPPRSPPPKRRSGGSLKYGVAALAIGLIAGGWFYRDVVSSYLPSDAMTALDQRVGTLEASNKTINEQLAAVSSAAETAGTTAANLDASVKSAAEAAGAAGNDAKAATARIADVEKSIAALRDDVDRLRQTVTTAGAGTGTGGSADPAALAAIGQRLDALEKDVASLKSSGGGGADTAALTQALSDLKAKIASGVAYRAEYDRIFRMVPAAAGLDVLAAFADAGLPTAQGLAADLRAGIPTLPRPVGDAPSTDQSYWGTVLDSLSGIITIRDIGEADWPGLAEKCASLAEANDLQQAIALIDGAEGDKPSLVAQWRDKAAGRLKLEAALGEAEKAVLRHIASLGGGQ